MGGCWRERKTLWFVPACPKVRRRLLALKKRNILNLKGCFYIFKNRKKTFYFLQVFLLTISRFKK
jgi:hypothetical protein